MPLVLSGDRANLALITPCMLKHSWIREFKEAYPGFDSTKTLIGK